MRFKRSKIYVSVIPVWIIGFIIGFIGAVMGIGGGFLLVPALIYFIRVPTGVVIGTSHGAHADHDGARRPSCTPPPTISSMRCWR